MKEEPKTEIEKDDTWKRYDSAYRTVNAYQNVGAFRIENGRVTLMLTKDGEDIWYSDLYSFAEDMQKRLNENPSRRSNGTYPIYAQVRVVRETHNRGAT